MEDFRPVQAWATGEIRAVQGRAYGCFGPSRDGPMEEHRPVQAWAIKECRPA